MHMSQIGKWSAAISFALCLAGGSWILVLEGFDTNDPMGTGIGLYFLGKAFFVGPMLLSVSTRLSDK